MLRELRSLRSSKMTWTYSAGILTCGLHNIEVKKRLREFLIESLKGVLWVDTTFSWFADVHAFVAVLVSRIFRRKSIVVVGGYEVAKVLEVKEGI